MGLDMYLTKSHSVKNWDPLAPKYIVTVTKNGASVPGINESRIKYVIEELAYWRKANAIHNWFVKNCQNDVDDCREYDVERESLEELLSVMNEILNTTEGEHRDKLALEKLPPVPGFFFGDTGINQWYYDALEYTQERLTDILSEPASGLFHYRASW